MLGVRGRRPWGWRRKVRLLWLPLLAILSLLPRLSLLCLLSLVSLLSLGWRRRRYLRISASAHDGPALLSGNSCQVWRVQM